MNANRIFRCLLWLCPLDYCRQFSEEMASVFEQRSGEITKESRILSRAFLLSETSGIFKEAFLKWLTKIVAINRTRSQCGPEVPVTPLLSMEEVARQRAAAIRNMDAAIAEHDFVAARRNSDEEVRLAQVLETLESDGVAREREFA
jgi:hypothetical protein